LLEKVLSYFWNTNAVQPVNLSPNLIESSELAKEESHSKTMVNSSVQYRIIAVIGCRDREPGYERIITFVKSKLLKWADI